MLAKQIPGIYPWVRSAEYPLWSCEAEISCEPLDEKYLVRLDALHGCASTLASTSPSLQTAVPYIARISFTVVSCASSTPEPTRQDKDLSIYPVSRGLQDEYIQQDLTCLPAVEMSVARSLLTCQTGNCVPLISIYTYLQLLLRFVTRTPSPKRTHAGNVSRAG